MLLPDLWTQTECGYQFTSKMEGMFNDMRLSREFNELYEGFCRDATGAAVRARARYSLAQCRRGC